MTSDILHRFSFREAPIRGQWVQLRSVLKKLGERRVYPPGVSGLLAEMLAAVAMVAEGIQFRGTVALQSRGPGPLTTVLAECREQRLLRGIAHWPSTTTPLPTGTLKELLGAGQLAMTLYTEARRGEKPVAYQGLIALADDSLAGNLERYFADSEQLPTKFFFAPGTDTVTGLLLQRLPVKETAGGIERERQTALWEDIVALSNSLDPLKLSLFEPAQFLAEVFAPHPLTLYPAKHLEFACTCSRQKTQATLSALGRAELLDILAEQGSISVTCEVCGLVYGYEAVDVHLLLDGSKRVH
jgi:molecular chaperone Hsp33